MTSGARSWPRPRAAASAAPVGSRLAAATRPSAAARGPPVVAEEAAGGPPAATPSASHVWRRGYRPCNREAANALTQPRGPGPCPTARPRQARRAKAAAAAAWGTSHVPPGRCPPRSDTCTSSSCSRQTGSRRLGTRAGPPQCRPPLSRCATFSASPCRSTAAGAGHRLYCIRPEARRAPRLPGSRRARPRPGRGTRSPQTSKSCG
mmetsp:Transcript_16310/g.47241  ORF Transcript_16310/g.47241 Transcript_16310/m.47241 type:complete len:206 (-) Transcript_16310:414-1031(-)